MSSGVIVDIESSAGGNFQIDDMNGEITAIIYDTRAFSDRMETLLNDNVTKLEALVGNYNPDIIPGPATIPDLDKPWFPNVPVLGDFVSSVWDTLVNKVKNDIISGGNGLTGAVYSAILAREKEARRNNQDQAYRDALDAVGEQGFNLPSGHVSALQSEVIKEILAKDQDATNNILVKDFDTATENTRFAVQMGIELEKILRQAWESTEERKVALFDAQTKGAASQYASLVKWAQTTMEGIRIKAEVDIKNGELGLDAYKAMAEFAAKISEAIASYAMQGIASALGAINTSVSNSYSGGESRGESWGHSESLGETHSFSEE